MNERHEQKISFIRCKLTDNFFSSIPRENGKSYLYHDKNTGKYKLGVKASEKDPKIILKY